MPHASGEMNPRFFREFYVYDLYSGEHMVFCSASEYKKKKAEDLFHTLSEEEYREWVSYLKSYQMTPAVADCCLGRVLLLPYLMPSASVAIVLVPDMKGSDLLKLAKRDARELVFLGEELRQAPMGRLHDGDGTLKERYERLMCAIERCYAHSEFGAREVPSEIGEILADRVEALSEFLQSPIRWWEKRRIMNYGEVDEGLFLAYVTVILTLAKNEPKLREAIFTLEERSYGCSVSIMLNGMIRPTHRPDDFFWMDSLAYKKRMLLELTRLPDGWYVRFSPMSRDWSYLGLKQNFQYDYGTEGEN